MTCHFNFADVCPLPAEPFHFDPVRQDLHDPLAEDSDKDVSIVTTERRLRRLAVAACDVGSRFAREAIAHDAAAWMLTPLECLDGERPLDACQDLGGFLRATLLNGLALGLDAPADALDALARDDDAEVDVALDADADASPAPRSLFTAEISGPVGWGALQVFAFVAMTAPDLGTFRSRLVARYGAALVDTASIEVGFDSTRACARELVSEASLRLVRAAQADPDGVLGSGLDVHGERRFAA